MACNTRYQKHHNFLVDNNADTEYRLQVKIGLLQARTSGIKIKYHHIMITKLEGRVILVSTNLK